VQADAVTRSGQFLPAYQSGKRQAAGSGQNDSNSDTLHSAGNIAAPKEV